MLWVLDPDTLEDMGPLFHKNSEHWDLLINKLYHFLVKRQGKVCHILLLEFRQGAHLPF